MIRFAVLVVCCCFSSGAIDAIAQEKADAWKPFRLLEGTWQGAIDGRLGQGVGQRTYEFVFGELYLVMKHVSVRMPQEKSPKGDQHQEIAVYSYDTERETIVLREFINEGYVLRYTCAVAQQKVTCTTEHVESGPGMKARLTLDIEDRFRFTETFELAAPGQELEVYFTNRWTRVPDVSGMAP